MDMDGSERLHRTNSCAHFYHQPLRLSQNSLYCVGPIIAECTKELLPPRRKSKSQLSHATASLGTHLSTVARILPHHLGLWKRKLDSLENYFLTISTLSRTMAEARWDSPQASSQSSTCPPRSPSSASITPLPSAMLGPTPHASEAGYTT
ncbi:hypothetical protein BGZ61DRAFT_37464 [Ilyonectria robusta]|uniref:uncharacterized protein n=1 Tax=Ilyonectria robusta TaxID=1079257 RepID=UPI001E8DCA23|nr:uncharacterized protein BGZ61DRAFT_37464 [Ilyonectria robusta]KAH8650417.1 hypothetical protein BGZ61DRAFT_37464 [Ilyonectria robusta]